MNHIRKTEKGEVFESVTDLIDWLLSGYYVYLFDCPRHANVIKNHTVKTLEYGIGMEWYSRAYHVGTLNPYRSRDNWCTE